MSSMGFARSLGFALIPLAVSCIVANVLLYFPDGNTQTTQDHLTDYVQYFMGIAGGGIVMLLPATVFVNLPKCASRCGSESLAICGSVLAALIGLAGSGYCCIISVLALIKGPKCLTSNEWKYPFSEEGGSYLKKRDLWKNCEQPVGVVEWNVVFFSILLALGGLEAIICAAQVISGLVAVVCRPCYYKQHYSLNT